MKDYKMLHIVDMQGRLIRKIVRGDAKIDVSGLSPGLMPLRSLEIRVGE